MPMISPIESWPGLNSVELSCRADHDIYAVHTDPTRSGIA